MLKGKEIKTIDEKVDRIVGNALLEGKLKFVVGRRTRGKRINRGVRERKSKKEKLR